MRLVLFLTLVALAACGEGTDPDAGPTDGSRPDSGGFDSGGFDSGGFDSGGIDSGPFDAGMSGCGPLAMPALTTEDVVDGMDWEGSGYYPVALAQPPGETDDLYVATQEGRIVLVRGGAISGTFLDLRSVVDFGAAGRNGERGLLGLAFHPAYASNGRFFVYYTEGRGATDQCNVALDGCRNVLAEYARSGNPDVASPTEVDRLIDEQDYVFPFGWNHNGGGIAFGRDGRLYVAMGDGGAGGDPENRALDTTTMFGKIHRLDVDNAAGGYAAAGNPFAGGGGLPQIWAYGLRNPWRFSFDRSNGDLYIGDVGQNVWEEIDIAPGSTTGGENYGWSAYEASSIFDSSQLGDVPVHAEPVLEYDHAGTQGIIGGVAVVGGYVYRGAAIPALQGWYLFGDYVGITFGGAPVAAFRYCDGAPQGVQTVDDLSGVLGIITSFGEDDSGELYMLGNSVVRIVAR